MWWPHPYWCAELVRIQGSFIEYWGDTHQRVFEYCKKVQRTEKKSSGIVYAIRLGPRPTKATRDIQSSAPMWLTVHLLQNLVATNIGSIKQKIMQANFSDLAVPEIDPMMWSTAMTVVNTTEWKKGKAESYRNVTCSRKYRKPVRRSLGGTTHSGLNGSHCVSRTKSWRSVCSVSSYTNNKNGIKEPAEFVMICYGLI